MINLLAATIIEPWGGILIFCGILFVAAVFGLVMFFVEKRKKPYIKQEDLACNCGKCQHPRAECENAENCEHYASCLEADEEIELTQEETDTLDEVYDAFVGVLTEEEPKVENEGVLEGVENIPEEETELRKTTDDAANSWIGKKVTREQILEVLKANNVKGITRLSKDELIAKCKELGIYCPV